MGFPGGTTCKEPAARAGVTGDLGSIPGSGGSPGGGQGNCLQCSCLENPVDRGAWRAAVHGVTKSRTEVTYTHKSLWGMHSLKTPPERKGESMHVIE